MRALRIGRVVWWLAAVAPAVLGTALLLNAQYDQNAAPPKIDISSYPPEIQRDYKVFNQKCSECHSTANSLKLSMSPEQWKYWVGHMAAMPSSNINDKDATEILAFLNYDEVHRTTAKATTAKAPVADQDSVARGRQFYLAQNCNLCHSIGGKGGSIGPPLDNVGNTQTRQQLIERMQGRRAGTIMPPLPKDTTDQQINDLVDFLVTLKGNQ